MIMLGNRKNIAKVSVVVPVYNVEKYIGRCARSLFEQTLDEMEFIFVDDGSTDNSIGVVEDVLKEFPKRKHQVTILHQKNSGLLQARARGVLSSNGCYLGTVDSDDWVDKDTYATLFAQAEKEKTDCVVMNYQREFGDHSEKASRNISERNSSTLMRNLYQFPFELFAWGQLVRNDNRLKNLYRNFYDMDEWRGVTMWEDVLVMMPYYYHTSRIAYCNEYFYHYNRENIDSALNSISENKARQAVKVVEYLHHYFRDDEQMTCSVGAMALGAKNMLLGKVSLSEWRSIGSWCNRYILRYSSIPLKIRLFYWMIAHHFDFVYNIYRKEKKYELKEVCNPK